MARKTLPLPEKGYLLEHFKGRSIIIYTETECLKFFELGSNSFSDLLAGRAIHPTGYRVTQVIDGQLQIPPARKIVDVEIKLADGTLHRLNFNTFLWQNGLIIGDGRETKDGDLPITNLAGIKTGMTYRRLNRAKF